MNVKKIMAGILSAAIAFTSVAFTAFANGESTPDWTNNESATVVAYGINNGGDLYFNKLTDALEAVYKSSPKEVVTLECKAGADVGAMTHGHVADSLIIKGNGAYVSSGERDLEVDTYKFDRSTGKLAQNYASDLEKDITIKVENLNGVGGWSQRQTSHTVNLEFIGCKKMHRVYYSGTTGVNNFKLTDCTFDGTNNENDKPVGGSSATSVYSNAPGTIELNNCTFKNVSLGVNLNNKSNGEQIVNINKCSFEDCAISANSKDWKSFAAPIRFVTSGENAKITASVAESEITYPTGKSNVGNGDILLGDGRINQKSTPNVTVNVSKTAAEAQVQFPGEADKTVKKTLAAADTTDISINMPAAATVAKIGDKEYATLADAIADAKSGDTIVLLDNIKFTDTFTISTLNKITIDFNDKIIDVTEVNEGKDSIVIESGADVTFTGNGGISANKSCIANYGAKLTLNGGTYTTQHKSRGTAIFNTDNATVELNAGAKIHSTNYGVYVGGNVKCVMNGAEIISSSYQGQSGIPNKVDYFYAVRNEGNLTINDGTVIKGIQGALSCLSDTVINGGTFETYETEESTGKSYYPVHIADKTKVVIKGGNFHSYARAAVYVSDDDIGTDGATAEIEGGVFTSGKAVNVIDATPGTNSAISVSGGTFGSDVSAYAKPGFSASKNEDGSYTVGKSEIVWETMTDSGVYTVNADNFGLMRFSFKTNVDAATISKVGVKFMNAKDITAETKSATISADKNANNFYGDLTEIAPTAGTKYFATAYIIMGDTTVWSDVIECSLNVKKQFTNYGGNQ